MGQLFYSFASLAERVINNTSCEIGMTRLANLYHDYEIPVTWMVSPESAKFTKKILTSWAEEYGDEVAMTLPTFASANSNSRAPLTTGNRNAKKELIEKRRAQLQKILPWAEVTIAAAGHTDPDIAGILEELGFEGLWGYCPEQIEIDDITDRGCPWGLFYIDPKQRLRPRPSGKGLVGIEWTARDLGKSILTGWPSVFSTDPNDVARTGICHWDNVDYWRELVLNYCDNAHINPHVFLVQHQEAHEMQEEPFRCYLKEDIEEAQGLLQRFLEFLGPNIQYTTLPEMVGIYRQSYAETAPSYMLWGDIKCLPPSRSYAWSCPIGPWPSTFLTYDKDAMMAFYDGQVEPFLLRDYSLDPTQHRYFNVPKTPDVHLVSINRQHWKSQVEIKINSPCAMPYGLALWGDYSLYRIDDPTGLKAHKFVPGYLLYVRIDLVEGENLVKIKLQGK
jgi:hypothetical protein